jgi:hypothetical protein
MHDDYLTALLPEPFCVMGVKLKPCSIGHVAVLCRFNVKLPTVDEGYSPADVVHAVFFLSKSWREIIALLERGYAEELNKFAAPWKKAKPSHLLEALKAFGEYWKEQSVRPDVMYSSKNGKPSSAPPIGLLYELFRHKLGYDEEEVMDMSYALAVYRMAIHNEQYGGVKFVDQELKRATEEFNSRKEHKDG